MKHKNAPKCSHCDLTVDEAELRKQKIQMIGCESS